MEKTVYILGAGFSIPAGAPSQGELLSQILELDDSDPGIKEAKSALQNFMRDDLHVDRPNMSGYALEDIYTPLDRCIADGTSFRSKTAAKLTELRGQIEYLISRAIGNKIKKKQIDCPHAAAYIHDFARYLVRIASRRAELAKDTDCAADAKQYDPLSVISFNWDILLDNALHEALRDDCSKCGDYDAFGVVDYCCYISSIEHDKRIRTGLWSLGCRGFNVKLLKLHGSMNWLQCPNCQRLFVGFGSKLDILARIGKDNCRHCEKHGHENRLQGSLVMPTFLKDLSNFQLKLIWQNASVELMEATKLAFIGYSLPHADFEFRQLLSRMAGKGVKIDVVLYQGADSTEMANYAAAEARYRQFFGGRTIKFFPEGAESYVAGLL